jgi:hypothetical protein
MSDRHDGPSAPASPDDDIPMTPAEMLALARTQENRVEDFFQTPTMIIVLTWGVAWTVGFLALWSASDASPIAVPAGPAGTVFVVLMVAGIVISGVVGTRTGAGVRGPQQVQARIYGITWALGCLAVPMLSGALFRAGMSAEVAALYFPAGYCIVVGILYLFGAALFSDRSMIVVGGWILFIGIVAPYFGAPGNYLVMSLAGGGAFLVYGIVLLIARSRRNRRVAGAPSRG